MLLFITGGGTGGKSDDDDHKQAFALTRVTGSRVALLHQVPNQPLLGEKTEDALIAETFVRYLETKDKNWPLLFPMVKSAVRAMDAVQAWDRERGKGEVKQFVVAGASKRGWTTWLTGAVDNRVIAIAPMVIVMLNIATQGPNQLDVWGQYSEQIDDYVNRGLMDGLGTSEEVLARQFRLHLHRGIGYLATPHKIGSISDLVKLATHKGSVSVAVSGPEFLDVRDGEELVSP